jgi:hypothetical protein
VKNDASTFESAKNLARRISNFYIPISRARTAPVSSLLQYTLDCCRALLRLQSEMMNGITFATNKRLNSPFLLGKEKNYANECAVS